MSTQRAIILNALGEGPKSNRELCELADEIPSYLSRTMAKLQHRGLVVNVAPSRGRGRPALYALASQARAT